MKQIISLFAFLLLCCAPAAAQEPYYSKYDWSREVEKVQNNASDTSKNEVLLFEKNSIEYRIEDEVSYQYVLSHSRTLVKTDKAIEDNNRMYVSTGPNDEVLMQKARVIKPNGTYTELKQDDIKESKNDDGEVEYRYFALDGLEIGSVIEYLQYIKKSSNYSGSSLYIQGSTDILKGEYDIISPNHLDILVYPVNELPEFTLDTTNTEVRRKFLNVTDLQALKGEYQSPYSALLQKCYYKLNKNLNTNKSNFYTYKNASKVVYDNMFSPASKGAQKKIKAITKDMESNGGTTLEDKLRYLEYTLKSTYQTVDANIDELENLDFVFDKKVTSMSGMTKLFVHVLQDAKINFELVLTSDREETPFLSEYEGYNFLDDYLVYIPEIDKYWSPGIMTRLGFPPYENTYNKGLFIQEKELNDLKVPVANVKEIKLVDGSLSADNITASVDFTADMNNPVIIIEREVSGYKALYPHCILDYLEDEKKTEAKNDIVQYIDESSKLEDVVYKNDASILAGKAPISVKARFVDAPFISTAGETILFKAGMLIGPQAELYNKEKRTQPIETEFNRVYNRRIELILPEGKQFKNLEVLNMNVVAEDKQTGFVSGYVIEGNKVIITIKEFYNKVYFPVEEYETYEKVMNAAADFNKVVLVLEK